MIDLLGLIDSGLFTPGTALHRVPESDGPKYEDLLNWAGFTTEVNYYDKGECSVRTLGEDL